MATRWAWTLTLLLLVAGTPLPGSGQGLVINRDPIADAGDDITAGEEEAVHLNATGSTDLDVEDREDLSFTWAVIDVSPELWDENTVMLDASNAAYDPPTTFDPTKDDVCVIMVACVGLDQPGQPQPCFVTPFIPPGLANAVNVVFAVYVEDGEDPVWDQWPADTPDIPVGTLPGDPDNQPQPPTVQVDEVTVTVLNSDQPPHGPTAGTRPSCSEARVLSEIALGIGREDADCLIDHGKTIPFTAAVYDDIGAQGGLVIFTDEDQKNVTTPLRASTPTTVAGGTWSGQTVSTLSGSFDVDNPFLRAGLFRLQAIAFDASGQFVDTGEQDASFSMSCNYEEVYDFEFVLVGEEEEESALPALCFIKGDNAPESTKYAPLPFGPNAILRVEASFPPVEGAVQPDEITHVEEDPDDDDNVVPLLLHKVTFQVCVGDAQNRVLGPETTLPSPWFLDMGSLPDGAQEVLFRGYTRDGREKQILVLLTADEEPPEALVVPPAETFFNVTFEITVYAHDALETSARLEMPDVDLNLLDEGQQPSLTLGSVGGGPKPPIRVPSLAGAAMFDIPVIDEGKRVFDAVNEAIFDENGDHEFEGYFNTVTQTRVSLIKRDCTQDGLEDYNADLDADGKFCGDGDIVIAVEPCGVPNAEQQLLIDFNGNGRCDKGLRQPSGANKDEYYLVLLTEGGQRDLRFGRGADGDPVVQAFLEEAPTTVYKFPVTRVGLKGECNEDDLEDVYLDEDSDRKCSPLRERHVLGEPNVGLAQFLDEAVPQLAVTEYRLRVNDTAGNTLAFNPQETVKAADKVVAYKLSPPIHYVGPWPASFGEGITVIVGSKEWKAVEGVPTGEQVGIDLANHTLLLGKALAIDTQIHVTYPTVIETGFAQTDTKLVSLRVEGRESRWMEQDGDLAIPGENFQPVPERRTDPPLPLLPGDVVRFNATVTQQSGEIAVPIDVTFDGKKAVSCSNTSAEAAVVVNVGEEATVCHLQFFTPGLKTVRAFASTSPFNFETDTSDQTDNVSFEVYYGMVRYTPPGADAPLEFYIRADSRGIVRMEGGALDVQGDHDESNDRSYDLVDDTEFVIRDEKGVEREIDVYSFVYQQSRTSKGKTETMNVTLYWNPLEKCDIQNEEQCGLDPKDFSLKDAGDCTAGETCRPITVVPTYEFGGKDKKSPGPGILVLVLVGLVAAMLRRKWA